MAVATLAQFKTATRLEAKGLRRGHLRDVRGRQIAVIDDCLFAYQAVRYGHDANQQSQTLSALLAACAAWLKAKKDKAGASVDTRRDVVLRLANDAFAELRTLQRARGTDHFHLHKALTTGRQVTYLTKSLSGGYAHERGVYLSRDKAEHPPSGSALHDVHSGLPTDGLPRAFNTPEGIALMARPWGHLTQADFEMLAAIHVSRYPREQAVHFADKATRAERLMVVYRGQGADFETVAGRAYDTQADPNGYMYAMDEYGTLFASPANGLAKGLNYWNHSSFNAGKDVICAGMIRIHAGRLRYVDTTSGHYKPSRRHLRGMLRILAAEGIDLAGVTVQVRDPSPGGMIAKHTLNAEQFVANGALVDPDVQLVPAT